MAVKALACELPSRLGVPLSRLHVPDIASEVRARGIAQVLDLYARTWEGEPTAVPFEWKFTRSDLAKILERLADKPDYRAAA